MNKHVNNIPVEAADKSFAASRDGKVRASSVVNCATARRSQLSVDRRIGDPMMRGTV